jgi:HTH-type transcriptional regulator/antitoxin HigA
MLTCILARVGWALHMDGMPKKLPSPAAFIREQLDVRGMTQIDLAFVLGVAQQSVSQLVLGKRGVSAEMAKALGEVFEVPPEDILQMQKAGEIEAELARAREPGPAIARKARLTQAYPIREMIKRGWLVDEPETLEEQAARFFGVKTSGEIPYMAHAAKKTSYDETIPPAQLAWLYRAKRMATDMLASPYSARAVRAAIPKLKALLASEEEVRKVPRIMSEAGIRFVIVESIKGAKIDGVCFWLDDESPVIAMTLRYDRIDNFWFVIRHELEHVLCHHGRETVVIDTELEGTRAGIGPDVAEEERVANAAAADFCVSQKAIEGFVARKAPFFAERDIIGFARTQQIHPGLVAGQLQHRTGRYDLFRAHQVPIRKLVARGSMVDGWGDVAPTEA